MARLMWNTISVIFDIIKLANTTNNLFDPWLRSFSHKQMNQVFGVTTFCWALWLSRNDVVFQQSKSNSFLQVMFRRTFWIRIWSIVSKKRKKRALRKKVVVGWRQRRWIFSKEKWLECLKRIKNKN
jgi:hypothetical protein